MMENNILVTAVAGDIGQAVIKCLKGLPRPCRVIGCDIDPVGSVVGGGDDFVLAPSARDTKVYMDFLFSVVAHHKIRHIVPASDAELYFFHTHRRETEKRGLHVLIVAEHIYQTFMHKYETVRFLSSKGLSCPRTYLLDEYQRGLPYPLIVKPCISAGGHGLFKVENDEQLNAVKVLMRDAVVQEYLPGEDQEYTTGVFSDGKKCSSITFRRILGFNGVSRVVEPMEDCAADEIAHEIAMACGLVGALNIQSRKVGNKHYIFEINPRLSSTVYFRHSFGFQDVVWWLDGSIPAHKLNYSKGKGIRVLTEVFTNKV